MTGRRNNNNNNIINNNNIGNKSNLATTASTANTATTVTNGNGSTVRASRGHLRSRGTETSSSSSSTVFHPKLITAQIIALQCFHYFILAFFFQVNYVLFNRSITIDRIFTDHHVRLGNAAGWADAWAILLASIVGAVLLAIIVEKSKKCLDFSVTLFLIHLLCSTVYGGFPTRLDWWVVHVLGTIIMIVLGEYLCSLRELDDIPLLPLRS